MFLIDGEYKQEEDKIALTFTDRARALIAWETFKEMANKGVIAMDWLKLTHCVSQSGVDSENSDWSTLAKWSA